MIKFILERKKISYDFKINPNLPDGFDNNYKNNSQDWLIVQDEHCELARFKCQSVANYCFGQMKTADSVAWGDTVAPGPLKLDYLLSPVIFTEKSMKLLKPLTLTDRESTLTQCRQLTKDFKTADG